MIQAVEFGVSDLGFRAWALGFMRIVTGYSGCNRILRLNNTLMVKSIQWSSCFRGKLMSIVEELLYTWFWHETEESRMAELRSYWHLLYHPD